jgi:hypothetical protein
LEHRLGAWVKLLCKPMVLFSAAGWAPAHVEQPVLAIVLCSDIQHLVKASLKMRVVS